VAWWNSDPVYGLGPFSVLGESVSTNQVYGGRAVVCAVTNSPLLVNASTRAVCAGWMGSGSVVSGIGTNSGAQVIGANSGLAWNWSTQYWLAVSADDHGLVDKSSAWYAAGDSVTLEAVPTSPGYTFVSWSGLSPDLATNNPVTLVMSNGFSVKANFGMEWLTIMASNGPNGTISPSGTVVVAKGGDQSFDLQPAPGYRVARVLVDGESNGVSDYLEFVNVQADREVYVEFEQDSIPLQVFSRYGTAEPQANKLSYQDGGSTVVCSITDSPVPVGAYTQYLCFGWTGTGDVPESGSGVTTPGFLMTQYSTITWLWRTQALLQVTSSGSGTTDVSRAWIDRDEEVHVRATADEGYIFSQWQGDVPAGAQHDNPLTVRMDRTRSLTAVFDVFRPTINAAAGNNGVISPAGSVIVDYLSTPEFEIIPDEGYRIESVQVDGVPVGVQPFYQFEPVRADHTLAASFTDDSYDLIVTSTHGTADPPPGTNAISAASSFQCALSGSPVTNEPGTRYVCDGWTGSGSVPSSGDSLQTALLIMRSDSTITWNWTTQHWLSVTSAVGGSVNVTNGWRNRGVPVPLTATPYEGYTFLNWTGDTSGLNTKTNPLVLAVEQARDLTANFSANTYIITSSAGDKGRIWPEGPTDVAFGDTQSFAITPNDGYRVASVTVDGTNIGTMTVYTFNNVSAAHTIHADFELDEYTLTVASDHGNPVPAGSTHWYDANTEIACSLGGSPVLSGTTQYVCTGWSGTGSVPSTGTRTNTDLFTLTNNSSITWTWRTNYFLQVTAGDHGRVSTTGGWYQAGTTNVTVSAQPDGNWRFAGWSGDVPNSRTNDNPLSLDMTRARRLTANFSSNSVHVTTAFEGSGNVLPPSFEGAPGSDAAFTITPQSSFRIRSVMIDSNAVPITNYYGMTVLFTNITQDRRLDVVFGDDSFDLTVSSAHGRVSPSNGVYVYSSDRQVQCSLAGSPSLTASGLTRHVYTYWTGSGSVPASGTDSNVTFSMNDISTLTWNWKTQHLVRVGTSGAGTVNVPSNGWYDATGTVSLAATPQPLNRFVRWQGDVPAGAESNNPVIITSDVPRSVTAVFAADIITLTVDSERGTTLPSIGSHTFDYGTSTSVVMSTPYWPTNAVGTQYVCAGWSGQGAAPSSGTSTNTGEFALTADSQVTWNWATNYELRVASVVGGSVNVSGTWYAVGSTAALQAVAATGYLFSGWSGDVPAAQTNSNPLRLTMDHARAVTPVFVTNRPVLTVSSAHNVVSPVVGAHAGSYGRVTTCSVLTNPVVQGTTRYTVKGWTGTGSVPATGTLATVDVLMTNDSSITWLWQREYKLTATGGVNGSVTPASAWFDDGTTNAQVLAIASTGYQFAGWSGEVGFADTNANPISLTMDRARSVRAEFTVLRPTLKVSSPYGDCVPAPGTYNTWQQGEELELLVHKTPYPTNATATQYVCTGWSGSGSVPVSGTESYVQITLLDDSSIAWTWKTQYWLSVQANAYGSVSPTGGWFDAGSAVTVTPVAVEAHRFAYWTGDLPGPGATGNVPLVVTMNRSRSLGTVFVTNSPKLTVQTDFGIAVPAAGTHFGAFGREVECSVDCGPIAISATTQMVQRGWTGTGSIPSNGAACRFAAVLTNDSTLTWQWYPQYRLSVTSAANGSVVAETGWHDAGSNVTLRAVPDSFYRFTHWSGSPLPAGLSNRSELVIGMNRSYDLTAHFDTNNVIINASYEGTENGTMSPTGIIEVAPQGSATFTITPNPHCTVYLVVDGAYAGATNSYTFTNVIADHTIHAVFEKETVDLQIGSTYQNGRFNPPAGLISYEWGSNITCRATNSPVTNGLTRYSVTGWQGSGSVSNSGSGTQYGPFSLETNSSIIWQLDTNYWLDIRSTQHGSVDVASGWYGISNITLTAIASNHSQFVGWTGDTNGVTVLTNNAIRVRMDQPRSIEAVFIRDQYTLTIESAIGMCVPEPGIYPVDYGTPYPVFVTNNPVYEGSEATQYVCLGYNNGYGTHSGTSTIITVTNNATLSWLWQTNYYLGLSNSVGGHITNNTPAIISNDWVKAGYSLSLEALPDEYYTFNSWTGDLNDVTIQDNQALFFMRRPRRMYADFTAQFTTNLTPHWWLAQYGITNDFDNADNIDFDLDGYLTWEEWITYTDPTDSNSLLLVNSAARSNNLFRVTWSSATNRTYQVIRGTNMQDSLSVIASNISAAHAESAYLDTNPPPAGPWFYSVEALRPDTIDKH
jgi:hypothetical protein